MCGNKKASANTLELAQKSLCLLMQLMSSELYRLSATLASRDPLNVLTAA